MRKLVLVFLFISALAYAQGLIAAQQDIGQLISEACREDLAKSLGIEKDKIEVKSCEEVTWNDSALGFPQAGRFYMQVLMPGYRVVLSSAGADYEYHTNASIDKPVIKLNPALSMLAAAEQKMVREIIKEGNSLAIEKIIPVDLDEDEQNEAVVIYFYGAHSSGAKVIKFDNGKALVIFEREASTPVTEYKLIDGAPALVFTESDFTPNYAESKKYQVVYKWDGRTFVKKEL